MIRIVNLRNYELKENEMLIKVDRSNKVLGNRYYMHNESERNLVCNQYQEWFNRQINDTNRQNSVLIELRRIYSIAKEKNVALGCWCYPKRCHSETIKRFLEKYL